MTASNKTAKTAKTASKGKAAPKAKGKAAPKVVRAKVSIAFAIGQGFRPVAGRMLVAYTAAWMSATGFDKGAAIKRSELAKIAGETAIAYHTKQGNMVATKEGITITARGQGVFSSRPVEPQLVDAYMSILKTGKPNADVSVTAGKIVALKAAA